MGHRLKIIFAAAALFAAAVSQAAAGISPAPVYQSWTPTGRASLTAGTSSTNVALSAANSNVLRICNRGTVDAYLNFGVDNTVTASVATGYLLESGFCRTYAAFSGSGVLQSYIAGITNSSSATIYIEGGIGTPISLNVSSGPAIPVGADPSATIGASAVNGSASTFMRSDAAPALPATLPALSGVNLTALNASNLASGTVAAARGGAGTITGALRGNGAGIVTQAACADLSDAANGCSGTLPVGANPTGTIGASAVNGVATTFMRSDAAPALPATLPALSGVNLTALNASNLASGTVAAARGGAGTITGALRGNGAGVVTQAACADLSDAANGCSGTLPTAANPSATIGASAVNGSASTFMRSDAAPALPATLPALSGVNLTALNGSNIASGTVADARIAAALTGKSYNGLTVSTSTGTLTIANSSSLITSGAFATTLTSSATTNSTLPAGTHSLAPLDSPAFTTPNIGVGAGTSLATTGNIGLSGAGISGSKVINISTGVPSSVTRGIDYEETACATGEAGDCFGIIISMAGAATTNHGLYVAATGGTTNYAVDVVSGSIHMPAIASDSGLADSSLCWLTVAQTFAKGSGTLGVCLGTSSMRYKNSISDLAPGLDAIMGLKPKRYFLNPDAGDSTKPYYGFMAEDGAGVLPELVGRDASGAPNTFDYVGVVPVLVHAVQELQSEVLALRSDLVAAKLQP